MLDQADAARLFDYTIWANHRVMRGAALLSVEDYKRDLGSSFGGVRGTLVHMMGAEWVWLERWKGVSPTAFMDEGEFPDIVALRDRWAAIEEHRAAWLRNIAERELAGSFSYRNVQGEPFTSPLWQTVQHTVNHSTYHRGQVAAFLRQFGGKPQATDLVVFDRERAAAGR